MQQMKCVNNLYQCAAFTNGMQLLDLGNIKAGETYVDTLVAVVETLQNC
jgi:hypothetical protein